MTSRLSELVTESERARLDLQMLFGVHVYSRAKVVPDLALSRGEDAHRAARLQGDRTIEFLAAGGVAMSLLELGDVDGAERWIGLAAAAASMAPSRPRARQLETWRGMARAGAGDVEGMRQPSRARRRDGDRRGPGVRAVRGPGPPCHRGGAVSSRVASSDGSAAAQGGAPDPALVELVERSAAQVKELLPLLPGHAPWGAQADAALATVALARGDIEAAVDGRRCGLPGPPGRAPRGRQPGDRHPGGPGRLRRGAAGGPGIRPRLPPVHAVQDRAGNGRRIDPRSMAHRARRARARRAGRPDGRARPRRRGRHRAGVRGAARPARPGR